MARFVFLVLILAAAGGAGFYIWQNSQKTTATIPAAETSESFVEVGGLKVRYEDEGPRNAPVLIMLHGFTFSLESYDALAERLSSDYRVVRYDLRGHGMTGPDPQKRYAPQQRAEHIGDVMDALGIEKATVIGNSLGGLAAWRFAAVQPERVENLVLISPGAYPINGVTEEPADVPMVLAAYLKTVPEPALEASLRRIYADAERLGAERKQEIRAMMVREGNGQAFVDALEVFTLPDPEPILAEVGVPTLIVWGAQDQVIPPEHGAMLEAVMPDATLLSLPDAGHVAHEEEPAVVAGAIRKFLNDQAKKG